MINPDQLTNANPDRVMAGAMAVFSTIQDIPADIRAAAAAVAFKQFFDTSGHQPQDLMTVAGNLIRWAEDHDKQRRVQTIASYVEEDL